MTRLANRYLLQPLLGAAVLVATACAPTLGSRPNLVGGEWQITEIAGQVPLANVPVSVAFGAEGRVSGAGSCNRYMGSYSLSGGNQIRLGQMASTMMACPDAQMQQNKRLLDALAQVTTYQVVGGTLQLEAGGQVVVRATR